MSDNSLDGLAKLKWPDDFIDKVICGDCLKVLLYIPDEAIDLILIDPPWALGKKEYDIEKQMNTFCSAMPCLYRVLKQNGHFLCDMGYTEIFKANDIIAPYLIFRQPIILYCNNQIGHRSFAGWNHFRLILWYCKGSKRPPVKKYRDVIEFPMHSSKKEGWTYPNPKDIWSYCKLIEMFSNEGDMVLDSFMGSGTTAIAAKKTGRHFIGIEINPEYCKIAERRLAQTAYQPELAL